MLSQRKQVMARMVGAFEKRPIETFLKRLALGQESIVRYEKEALEKVVEVAAWDGKDGQLPTEEEEEEEGGKDEL
eukprot:COSAG06_NODE_4610_length_4102_cov_5.658506_3_plen_75_part_00